jgi:hypothetical protein
MPPVDECWPSKRPGETRRNTKRRKRPAIPTIGWREIALLVLRHTVATSVVRWSRLISTEESGTDILTRVNVEEVCNET